MLGKWDKYRGVAVGMDLSREEPNSAGRGTQSRNLNLSARPACRAVATTLNNNRALQKATSTGRVLPSAGTGPGAGTRDNVAGYGRPGCHAQKELQLLNSQHSRLSTQLRSFASLTLPSGTQQAAAAAAAGRVSAIGRRPTGGGQPARDPGHCGRPEVEVGLLAGGHAVGLLEGAQPVVVDLAVAVVAAKCMGASRRGGKGGGLGDAGSEGKKLRSGAAASDSGGLEGKSGAVECGLCS